MSQPAGWLLVAALAGCQAVLPSYTIHVPARLDEVEPPRSTLAVSAPIAIDGVEAALENAMPPDLAGAGRVSLHGLAVSARWRLQRELVALQAVDDGVELSLKARVSLDIGVGPIRCHSDNVVVAAVARGRPSVEGGVLVLLDHPSIHASTEGSLRCAAIDVPLALVLDTPFLLLSRALERLLPLFRVPIAPVVRTALDEVAVPREITLEDRRACLELQPFALAIAPLGGHDRELMVRLAVEVAPRVSIGHCPALPRHELRTVAVRETAIADSFAVDVALVLPHEKLQPLIDRHIVGHRFGSLTRSIKIDRAELGDAEGHVLLRAHVHGALAGEVYLWGTPVPVRRDGRLRIEVPDLKVAAECEKVVERIKLALWQLLGGSLSVAAKKALEIDVTDRVAAMERKLPAELERAFWGGTLRLRVQPQAIEPIAVESHPGVIALIVRLTGRAQIALDTSSAPSHAASQPGEQEMRSSRVR